MASKVKMNAIPQNKSLVFTSAGDNNNLLGWCSGFKNFDLWTSYYGDNPSEKLINASDYFYMKKGGKFPNFHYAFNNYKKIFDKYEAILIMDDDILIDSKDINRLFKVREEKDLWLLQPSFSRKGKISFRINEVSIFSKIRFTNFVEITCPLFEMERLKSFMKVYEPKLNCWGVDLWYCQHLMKDRDFNNRKIAIVDEVVCINPKDSHKPGGQREIDILLTENERKKSWEEIMNKYNLMDFYPQITYEKEWCFSSKKVIKNSIFKLLMKYSYLFYKKITRGKVYPTM